MKGKGIEVIINLSSEKCPNLFEGQFEYESFDIPDKPTVEIVPLLKVINNKIDLNLQSGKRVIVHCYKGISRAPTIIISYLMAFRALTLEQAFDFVR